MKYRLLNGAATSSVHERKPHRDRRAEHCCIEIRERHFHWKIKADWGLFLPPPALNG
ncbi:hypothetical protein IG631_15391 [Alternaria alternata]|nr:hypothetical protein IG631_15391 [Alternaria alternata]